MPALSRFRRVARVIATVLLLTGTAVFVHVGADDVACAPGAMEGSSDSVAADTSTQGDHCLVCHWTRSLRTPLACSTHVGSALMEAARIEPQAIDGHRAPALDRLPARAPPATL